MQGAKLHYGVQYYNYDYSVPEFPHDGNIKTKCFYCIFLVHFYLSPTGVTNDFFEAVVNVSDIDVPKISCKFLNGPVSSASCQISYGTNQNYTSPSNSVSANDTDTTAVTLQLAQLQPNTEYYYIVLAIGDSMRARIRGSFMTGMYPYPYIFVCSMGNSVKRQDCSLFLIIIVWDIPLLCQITVHGYHHFASMFLPRQLQYASATPAYCFIIHNTLCSLVHSCCCSLFGCIKYIFCEQLFKKSQECLFASGSSHLVCSR